MAHTISTVIGVIGKTLFKAVLAVACVAAALAAALTTHFVLFGPSALGPGKGSYSNFLKGSVEGFQTLLGPSALIGALMFVLYLSVHKRLNGGQTLARLLRAGWAGFTLFYTLTGGYVLLWGGEATVPRLTLLLAWLFSLAMYAIYKISQTWENDTVFPSFSQPVIYSRGAQLAIDAAVVALGFALSYLIRFDGYPPLASQQQFVFMLPYVVAGFILVNQLWGVNGFIWRFTSIREALILILSVATASTVFFFLRLFILQRYDISRIPFGVLIVLPVVVYTGFIGVRCLRRIQVNYGSRRNGNSGTRRRKRTILIGAGDAGASLVHDLKGRSAFEFVGFLDDDPKKKHRVIHGIRVLGTTRQLREVVEDREVEEAIFCMPSAPRAVMQRILAECEALGLKNSTVPSLSDVLLRKVSVTKLRPVRMEELLERDSVVFPEGDRQLITTYQAKRILITGAAGSIGSELARQVAGFRPRCLVLLDKDENGLFEVGLDLRENYSGELFEVVANIRDQHRLESVFRRYRPEVVLHAAAYKHVPMMEHHPSEAVLNNTVGTRQLVETAAEFGVSLFLLISTDKAVNPTNVMGASKRVAEMVVRRQARLTPQLRCCCVRFGNVLGSRASVVPLFQKRIAEGKNLHVTHAEIRRYFMTIPEAVQLVLQAASLAVRSETFVLDMGDPVRIMDLARNLIEQSGLELGKDIEIEVTGLRPGEKLYEELLVDPENGTRSTKYPKIFIDPPMERDPDFVREAVERLIVAAEAEDREAICAVFESLGIGYRQQIVPLAKSSAKG